MTGDSWAVLTQHHIPAAWVPIDAGQTELLFIESELLEAGIDVAFDPRRPGDAFYTRSAAMDLKLLVKESDLARARQIMQDVEQPQATVPEAVEDDSFEGEALEVGDRVAFASSRPESTVWGGFDADWDPADDALLGVTATITEFDSDGWFRVDIDPNDGLFVPPWVKRVDAPAQ